MKPKPIRRRKPVPLWLWQISIASFFCLSLGILTILGLIVYSDSKISINDSLARIEQAIASNNIKLPTEDKDQITPPTLVPTTPVPSTSVPTQTPVPTATATPMPTATATATATPTPTLVLMVFDETPVANIERLATPELIGEESGKLSAVYINYNLGMGDGLADWPADAIQYTMPHTLFVSEGWDGTDDISAVFQLSYNDQFLYLTTTITDDTHSQTRRDKWIGIGDAIELLIDAERIEDISGGVSPDDFQILLSPGDSTRQIPPANFVRQGNNTGQLVDIGEVTDIKLGAVQVSNGYQLEIGIPWTLLDITPESGKLLGISISVNDSDAADNTQIQFKSMLTGRGLTDPNSWGEVILE